MKLSANVQPGKSYLNAAICISFAGLVSSGHHIYGAIIYETPWRIGVSLWIPGIACLILSMLYLLWKYPGTLVADLAAWIVLVGGVIFQSGFTMFECVYSHVLKIILFVVDTPQNILELLYPAPTYHLPDNIVFELTGLAQLVGFIAAWRAWMVFANYQGSK